jgi:16S rRNA (guanine1207-N2)-methyltransferase
MSDAATALTKLFDSGSLNAPDGDALIGVWATQPCAEIIPYLTKDRSHTDNLRLWCPFYPWAKALSQDFTLPLMQEMVCTEELDLALILPAKQKDETAILIASALQSLKKGGQLIIVAANDAGGNRLRKTLEGFGLTIDTVHSKQKCKVVCATIDGFDGEAITAILKTAEPQDILDGQYKSQIGLYGWNKIDIGSALLAEHIPDDLHGLGADFGCGYGFLSRHIIETNPKVKKLCIIDADRRAVELAQVNLAGHESITHPIWGDLTAPDKLPKNLDFVIMNPPFHSGKGANSAIGIKFIESAHHALKRYGQLYIVANNHLPYERSLNELFHKYEIIAQKNGFKVICAGK